MDKYHETNKQMGRYNMCADQPAQIDCRNIKCKFHTDKGCSNVSPAITLSPTAGPGIALTATCWSFEKVKTLTDKITDILDEHAVSINGTNAIRAHQIKSIADLITKLIKDENPG